MTQNIQGMPVFDTGVVRTAQVLVVDDDGFDRERIRRMCRDVGVSLELSEVGTVPEMQAMVNEKRFDLILLDYHLGSANGIEVLSDIRASSLNSAASIVIIAGLWKTDISTAAIKYGCSDYIEKNCLNARAIERAVVNALRKSEEAAAPVDAPDSGPEVVSVAEEAGPATLHGLDTRMFENLSPLLADMLVHVDQIRGSGNPSDNQDVFACLSEIEATALRLIAAQERLSALKSKG
jgi:CheY-like chemotaxis protein